MTVRELIEELSKYDGSHEVLVFRTDPSGFEELTDIEPEDVAQASGVSNVVLIDIDKP